MTKLLLTAVIAALLGAGGAWAVLRADTIELSAGVTVEDLAEIASVSEQFGVALLTYDAGDLDAARVALEDLATPGFLTLYEDTFAAGLAGSIGEEDGSAVAAAREVFVGPVVGDVASAVLVMDAQVTGAAGVRNLVGVYLRLDLARVGSAWLVDELTTLTAEDVEVTSTEG